MSVDLQKKSFDFASSTTKQLITLSTALLGLSLTFRKSFSSGSDDTYLLISWLSLFLSICFGVYTLMALTGSLSKSITDASVLDLYKLNIRVPSFLQILTFVAGVFMFGLFSVESIENDKTTEKEKPKIIVCCKECNKE